MNTFSQINPTYSGFNPAMMMQPTCPGVQNTMTPIPLVPIPPPYFLVTPESFIMGSLNDGSFTHGFDPTAPHMPPAFQEYARQATISPNGSFVPPPMLYLSSSPRLQVVPGSNSVSPMASPNMMPQQCFSPAAAHEFTLPPSGMSHIAAPAFYKADPTQHVPQMVDATEPPIRQETVNPTFQDDYYQPHEAVERLNQLEACYREFLDHSGVLNEPYRVANREGRRWYKREKKAVAALTKALKSNYEYWQERGDISLLQPYNAVVYAMANLIAFESTKSPNRRGIKDLCYRFRKTLEYLKRENFDTQGALNFSADKFEKIRSLMIHIRAFKNIQMQRFANFHLTLSKNNPDNKDKDESSLEKKDKYEDKLRGDMVVRNRCKRMASFWKDAHDFDAHVHNLIKSGAVDVNGMYICFDHKASTKKKQNKERVVAGLLFYFVCPDAKAAENLLRELVRFCEHAETPEKREIYQDMFRKKESRKEDDFVKRDRLCSSEPWTAAEFKDQKEMYHFTLAQRSKKEKPIADPTPLLLKENAEPESAGPSPSVSLKSVHSPYTSRSRRSSIELGRNSAGC